MMLSEETVVPQAALPLQLMKDHLRLGSGFSDDGLQDALILGYLRAAMAAIEGRIGKILLSRRFRWTLEGWRWADRQTLPVAPVASVVSLAVVDAGGVATVIDADRYQLVKDLHRPVISARGTALPTIPSDGRAEILFDAGFGPDWGSLPADLQQAVLLLASEYHEHRHEFGLREAAMPFGILALIERWRTVRILGGGGA
jgi:uncharacterized phiE125 gp8 family phage protein